MTSRPRVSLDGHWHFWTDPDNRLEPASLDEAAARLMRVPAPWQALADDLRYYTGTAWYQRRLDLPAEWLPEGRIILGFDAADYCAEVFVNGRRVGEHEGGYLPFELDVTHAVRPGANTLTVRVSDPDENFAEVPHGKQAWYGPLSGLWQSVWVERRPATHVRRVHVTARPAEACADVDVTLSQPPPAGAVLEVELRAPGGEVCARQSLPAPASDSARVRLDVPDPQLWDVDQPHLYTAHITLRCDGDADSVTETFGFRTIEARGGRLLLNGRPLYLRGALDQDYYPELICTPPSLEYIEDSFRKARAMGLNCLRVHIKVADPRYYAAADRVGLLIWTELPNWSRLTPTAMRLGRETIAGMVQRDWNHPSIIIWTIINEAWGTELYGNPEHRAWLAETYAWLKSLDPTRLVVDNSACFPNSHVATDLNDYHFYAAVPDHYREWRAWVKSFAAAPAWTFAHAYQGIRAWKQFSRAPWKPAELPPSPEVRRLGDEPLIVSEFGNWGLPDVDALRACYGGQDPWWFDTGLEWGEGVVYPHGLEQRFRAYHLDRVFPTLGHLTTASQRMQFTALKYEIEQMRLQASLAGYVITEFTDVHWEANGLLDMCRNPKAHFHELSQINADDVIVPDWDRVAYWEGESVRVRLALSHYSSLDLNGGRVEWHLEGWPHARRAQTLRHVAPAGVTRLRSAMFVAPNVAHGTRDRLLLSVHGPDGALAARNYLDLYFFPHAAADPAQLAGTRLWAPELGPALRGRGYTVVERADDADVLVVTALTDAVRDRLQRGARVLWLAEAPQSLQTYLGNLRVVARHKRVWQGDWVSNFNWLNQSRMFGEIPTDGLVDFAFADLTPESVIVGLSPMDYLSSVHAGLFVGWIHRTVALVAEQPIGRGRLLISTFRLRRQLAGAGRAQPHPVAAIMLHDMLRHLAAAPAVEPAQPGLP